MFNPREGVNSLERFEFYYSLIREIPKFGGILKWVGIMPERTWTNKLCFVLFLISLSFVTIPEGFTMLTRPPNTARILESTGTYLVVINTVCKLLVLYYHRDELAKQEETCRNLWKETVSPKELLVLCHYARKGKAMTYNWLFLSFSYTVSYALSPFIVSLKDNFANRLNLPFLIGIEIESDSVLFCTYVAQVFAILIIFCTISGSDLLVPAIIFHACGHLKVLQSKLYDIKKHAIMPNKFVSSYNGRETILDETEMANNLKECIRRHQVILNSCSDIERYFNIFGLIEALCAVYHLCLAAIGILGVKYFSTFFERFKKRGQKIVLYKFEAMRFRFLEITAIIPLRYIPQAPEHTLKFAVQIGCGFYHLFIFCSASDDLMTESAEVANAAFSLPWYYCSKSTQTNVLMIIARAEKRCQWTAGKYFALSLNAFITLVYNGISAFTVLRSFM